jgi:sensor histidine kinase regulating citrate/malate metabolism
MLLTNERTRKTSFKIEQDHDSIKISVTDSGNGIQKKQFKRVFEPGFTTKKKRLGIRIIFNKRIVEEYHRGSIKVSHSEIGKAPLCKSA